MDPRGGPRPSPFSVQTLDASSSNPIVRAQSQRASPEPAGGGYSQIIQGGAPRSAAANVATPQQNFASAQQTISGFEMQTKKKSADPYAPYDMNNMSSPPAYSDIEKHPLNLRDREPITKWWSFTKAECLETNHKVELGDHKTLRSKELWRAAAAEFIGTMLFVFLGCGSVIASGMISRDMTCSRLVVIAVAHGVAICCLAGATGAISGGHLNPAVTLAFVVAGKETLIRAGLYVVAQLLGAVIGACLIQSCTPQYLQRGLGSHDLGRSIFDSQGCLMEIMLSFMLIFVIFGVAVDRRGPGVIAPIPIGFAVLVDHLVGVPYTGASMNPARSFGPALVSGHWGRAHVIYWFGPCLGASLASAVYRYVGHVTDYLWRQQYHSSGKPHDIRVICKVA